jgi:hypothetical protein
LLLKKAKQEYKLLENNIETVGNSYAC